MNILRVLGVDPGLRGGLAIIQLGDVPEIIACIDIPVVGTGAKERVDVQVMASFLAQYRPSKAIVERAGAMPKQGVASSFKYGRAVGAIEAALAIGRIPVEIVEPSMWKKMFRLRGKDKEAARQLAQLKFPGGHGYLARKKDHGRAEACLIALYGANGMNG